MTLFDDGDFDRLPIFPKQPSESAAKKLAAHVAEWIARNVPETVRRHLPAALVPVETVSLDLKTVLEWWNRLADEKLVTHRVRVDNPSGEIQAAWAKFLKHGTARECMEDLDAVAEQIRRAPFTRKGPWFRLEKLLSGATNRAAVPIIRVLMDGGYRDDEKAVQEIDRTNGNRGVRSALGTDARGNGAAYDEYVRRYAVSE